MTEDRAVELVRELHPSADQPSGPDAARARAALVAEIERARRPRRHGSSFDLRPRRGRRRLATTLATGVAVAVAIALPLSLRGGVANPASAAAEVLQRAARAVTASGGPRPLRAGEYWYVKSYETSAGALVAAPSVRGGVRVIADALTTTERQAWISADRRGLDVRRITRPITFLSAAAREQWIRDGRPRQVFGQTRASVPPDQFVEPYRQLLALPTSVDALWRMLGRHEGNGSAAQRDAEIFTEIGDLLRAQPIPAAVRAALYRAAARIPGIRLLGMTRDAIGRPALAVAQNDAFSGMRNELLFDPRTYVLLGERSVVVKPPPAYHVTPGSVRTGSTYVTAGIAERIGQVPGR